MTGLSPIGRIIAGYRLRQRSARAVANTLRDLARICHRESREAEALRFARLGLRIGSCSSAMRYRARTVPGEPTRLEISNRRGCRTRICPQCERHRTRRLHKQLVEVITALWEIEPEARALLLTLTTRNRPLSDAKAMLADHQAALRRFWANPTIKRFTLGQLGSIEIAIRRRGGALMIGVHSHHMVIVHGPTFFAKGVPALHQTAWRDTWHRAARLDYRPLVDVRAIRDAIGYSSPAATKPALRETCKYIVASHTLFERTGDTLTVNPDVLRVLVPLLHRRRLTTMDRIFLEARRHRRRSIRSEAQSPLCASSSDPVASRSGCD